MWWSMCTERGGDGVHVISSHHYVMLGACELFSSATHKTQLVGCSLPLGRPNREPSPLSDSILVSFLTASRALRTAVPLSHWLSLAFHMTESMSFFLGLTFHLMSKPPDSPTLQPMARVHSSLPNKVPPHICVYTHMYIFTIIYIYVFVYIHIHAHTCVYMYIYMYVYTLSVHRADQSSVDGYLSGHSIVAMVRYVNRNTGKHVFL